MLAQYAAQSTVVVCNDIPPEIGDFYRLFLVLWYSNKPVVTGAFSAATLQAMIDLLAADSGSLETLKQKPRAVFDVCPSLPLNWTEFAAYLVASDSKLVDAQAGMESSISAVLGALAGINMISGAGMLDSLACHSVEKLVIDAAAIASAQRLLAGIEAHTETLAVSMFAAFLRMKETRALFRTEQHFPSAVIDRSAGEEVESKPLRDTFCRARACVNELLSSYSHPALRPEVKQNLLIIASREAKRAGLEHLPGI